MKKLRHSSVREPVVEELLQQHAAKKQKKPFLLAVKKK